MSRPKLFEGGPYTNQRPTLYPILYYIYISQTKGEMDIVYCRLLICQYTSYLCHQGMGTASLPLTAQASSTAPERSSGFLQALDGEVVDCRRKLMFIPHWWDLIRTTHRSKKLEKQFMSSTLWTAINPPMSTRCRQIGMSQS